MDVAVCRFVLDKRRFYVRTIWEDIDFELSIADGKRVWRGKGFLLSTLTIESLPILS